ncbi:MAG: HDOD domain-containing protein [candidate division Zixibacteria bacterium]|nr:HDOD domain-containing protein [candidate division Zixibacteria bacterium]
MKTADLDVLNSKIKINSIPMLPAYVMQVSYEMDKIEISAARIAELIAQDIGLSVRVLKLANSPIYGKVNVETISIYDAVSRIGFTEIKSICLSLGVARVFKDTNCKISISELWKHSISAAFATRVILSFANSQIKKQLSTDLLYTSGLLHDIGQLILAEQYPGEVSEIQRLYSQGKSKFWEIEYDILGFTHADVTGLVLRHWGFPEIVASITENHHGNFAVEENIRAYIEVLHIADIISDLCGLNQNTETMIEPLDSDAWDKLGLKEEDIPEIIAQTELRLSLAEIFTVL